MTDGFYGGETDRTRTFIDNYVTPLMNEYAEALVHGNDAYNVTKQFIKNDCSIA